MRRRFIAVLVTTIIAGLGFGTAAQAAPAVDELADIRAQLHGLIQRVERLEQDNASLRAQNEALKSPPAIPAAAVATSAPPPKPAAVDWTSRIAARGDLRYRWEQTHDDVTNRDGNDDTRYRDRIRARLGFDAKVTDQITATLLVATGGDDPRSANQTLGGANSRKPIGFDMAYFDWKYARWGNLTGGKMKYPLVRAGQSMFFDADVNPEGLALGFNRGIWFGSAYSFGVEERATAADAMLYGGQIGARVAINDSNLMLALQYSDLSHGQGFRPYYNSLANGNSTDDATQGGRLLYDFNVIELAAEFNTTLWSKPIQWWADLAQNQDPQDLNRAWASGFMIGKASSPRSWELGAAYQVVEKDALFAQIIESDFADGRTDSQGWVLRAGYAPAKNWTLNTLYFMTQRQMDVGTAVDGDRLQMDFNLRF